MTKLLLFDRTFLMFVCTILSSTSFAQPALKWSKCYGSGGAENGGYMVEAWGGGFILGGTADSCKYGSGDFLIVAMDDTGKELWTRCFGGTQGEYFNKILKVQGETTAANGFLLVGSTVSNDGDVSSSYGAGDYWLAKLDVNGNLQWEKAYGGSFGDHPYDAVQVKDGAIVIAGYSSSNDGDVTGSHGGNDFWILKLNQAGSVIWKKAFGGSQYELNPYVTATNDGGVAIAGVTFSNDGDVSHFIGASDIWLVKLDSSGNTQWNKTYGGWGLDAATSIMQTADNGYLIGASTTDFPASGLSHGLIKVNDTGAIEWTAAHRGVSRAIVAGNKQYIIVGSDDTAQLRKGYIRRIDSLGNTVWNKPAGGSTTDRLTSIYLSSDGGYTVGGATKSVDGDAISNHGEWDLWALRLGPDALYTKDIVNNHHIHIYPNPATNNIYFTEDVSVKLFNMLGQECAFAEWTRALDISNIPEGIYVALMYDKQGRIYSSHKVVKQ